MSDERLSPERSVRLLRAKAAELETQVLNGMHSPVNHLAADIALVAELLADHIEGQPVLTVQDHLRLEQPHPDEDR